MQSAFRAFLPKSYLSKLSVKEQIWAKRLKETGTFVIIAENANREVVGYAYAGRNRKPDPIYAGEALSHDHLYQRRRIAHCLMRAVAERLAVEGMYSFLAWTNSQNPARKFLEALGAVFVASTTYHVAGLTLEGVAYGWTDTAILRL